ncbi:MAG: threonine synthase [Myxococcales bacterium]|nr:threonine synthase [Myxococcales bacterium]
MLTQVAAAKASSGTVKALKCRECGREYPKLALHVCEFCFGPLEVAYDYDAARKLLSREVIERRPPTMWRYHELLPLDLPPTVGTQVGFTPLVRAHRLGARLGLSELYIKNDAVSYPTLSFKDRVVAVALSKARELGFETVACASTGNLANSVAANAAAAGLACYVFIPHDLEQGKVLGTLIFGATVVSIRGTYDEVNRLCSEIADKYRWGFVNVSLRPYYAEGSKSHGYEIQEQLGWRQPAHVVVPMASGSLLTKIGKSFDEFRRLGLVDEPRRPPKLHGAQAAGCSPIALAVARGQELIKPVKTPQTIAKSLAIGNPADGFYAARAIRQSGGHAAAVSDEEILDAMRLLAETEGIFTETAGGVTLAAARRLVAEGRIGPDESVVVCITGNGLKTMEAIAPHLGAPTTIGPKLAEFDQFITHQEKI